MGGLDWIALPIIAEMVGADDIDLFLTQLTTIRDYQNAHGR